MKHGRGGNVPACKQGRCGALFLARSGQPRSCRSGPSTTGFSRRVLVLLLPLRRQGEVGRGCPRFALIRKAPLPNPPLPSQGREPRSEEHTSELQSLMRISYAVFCLKKKNNKEHHITRNHYII